MDRRTDRQTDRQGQILMPPDYRHGGIKTELQFMCSAHCLMVFNFCMNVHENMSSSFKVMERTRKLLTHKGQ